MEVGREASFKQCRWNHSYAQLGLSHPTIPPSSGPWREQNFAVSPVDGVNGDGVLVGSTADSDGDSTGEFGVLPNSEPLE